MRVADAMEIVTAQSAQLSREMTAREAVGVLHRVIADSTDEPEGDVFQLISSLGYLAAMCAEVAAVASGKPVSTILQTLGRHVAALEDSLRGDDDGV